LSDPASAAYQNSKVAPWRDKSIAALALLRSDQTWRLHIGAAAIALASAPRKHIKAQINGVTAATAALRRLKRRQRLTWPLRCGDWRKHHRRGANLARMASLAAWTAWLSDWRKRISISISQQRSAAAWRIKKAW